MGRSGTRRFRTIGPHPIGLRAGDLDRLLNELDEVPSASSAPCQRDFIRWPFRLTRVPFQVRYANGDASTFDVACRNLSSGGVAVLHGAFMHVGTRCALVLPHSENGPTVIEGRVVRCEHRQGMVHEIGVKFDESIHALDYVKPEEFTDCFSLERVEIELLRGTVVHVESSMMDQRVVKHFLRASQVRVRPASTCEQAKRLIGEGCELVLCDLHMPNQDGAALLEEMRAAGVQTPWVIMTSDTSEATRERLEASSASAFLAKPFTQDLLLRAIAEFLVKGRGRSVYHCTLAPDDPAMPLVGAYVKELRTCATRLTKAMRGDRETVHRVCLTLKGNAATFGFEEVGRLAGAALTALERSERLDECSTAVETLVRSCRRASVRLRAA